MTTASSRVGEILTNVLDESSSGAGLPDLLVAACTAALPITGVGLVWMTDGGPGGMLAATDGAARRMEELQFTLGEGPCVDASTSGIPVLAPDLARMAVERWPGFGRGALDAGIRAIFAFPLRVGGIRVGVLDLYRDTAGDLSAPELAEALAFADAATSILLNLQAQSSPAELHPRLAEPIENRTHVHQATGMIAAQRDVPLADAFVLLRARSFATERTVSDLAADVVARLVRFDDDQQVDGNRH